jgi:hypothetical protein
VLARDCLVAAGTVFKLTRNSNGDWDEMGRESTSHLSGSDGMYPTGGLTLDAAGNLYGTTSLGGDLACNFGNGWRDGLQVDSLARCSPRASVPFYLNTPPSDFNDPSTFSQGTPTQVSVYSQQAISNGDNLLALGILAQRLEYLLQATAGFRRC